MPGLFIAFEGPEGAGKSTQVGRLARRLAAAGLDPVVTREPGGTPLGDAVREVVLDPRLTVGPLAEFLLYSASRAQHMTELIAPALAAGRVVISDRFSGASVAYQGYGRGLELGFVHSLSERVTGGRRPDLTLLLDLDPRLGLRRVERRGAADRLELADLEFHARVRSGFLEQAHSEAGWVVLEASRGVDEVAEAVWAAVRPLLGRSVDPPAVEP